MEMSNVKGNHIHISGIVQGVGFRPFVYKLARKFNLVGWVKNTSSGVEIEVIGTDSHLRSFIKHLESDAPPLAKLDEVIVSDCSVVDYQNFEILTSESISSAFQPIPADVAICSDCLTEMLNPKDRRFRYPFINCTNCGPRFTIIKDIPYDRPLTSMAVFQMCPRCSDEYKDPANRRFHAQPIACPDCGPKVWLEQYRSGDNEATVSVMQIGDDAIQRTRRLLNEDKIVAIKGLGGFHLACNAKSPQAVAELRRRKLRVDKPFAVMMPDVETIKRHCHVSEAERALLESPAHPIVLLRRRSISMITGDIAPGQRMIGVMLPYTPLHVLLLEKEKGYSEVLVMTSGNISDEPICTDNVEARERMADLADAFLMHDRDIHIRTDDSVMRVFNKEIYPVRCSRGYSPYPVFLPWSVPSVLAVGAELKNTFCLTNGRYAFLSHHIGDLENYETLKSFEDGISHFERLFRVKPEAIAYDMHPNYLATRYGLERTTREGIPGINVQHHHAHIASLMAEQGLDGSRPVIGVAFDGTGYGDDGAIWGGEFLVADYSGYSRAAHLRYFPLPGGDAAIRRPSRTALSLLFSLGLDWDERLATHSDLCSDERSALRAQLEHKINSPLTSSIGRLFDAASALAGVRQKVNYEAQAAIEFETMADPDETGLYEFEYVDGQINPKAAIEALLADVFSGVNVGKISSKFHSGLARIVSDICGKIGDNYDMSEVALSGGVWQNMTLLYKTVSYLEKDGFTVHIHHRVPTNDGGLALGQAAIAAYRLRN